MANDELDDKEINFDKSFTMIRKLGVMMQKEKDCGTFLLSNFILSKRLFI